MDKHIRSLRKTAKLLGNDDHIIRPDDDDDE